MSNVLLGALLASIVGLIGVIITISRTNKWNKRQETYLNLRWAVDKTESSNIAVKRNGLLMLKLLLKSELLQKEDVEMIYGFTNYINEVKK